MDSHDREPPDKHQSDDITAHTESVFCGMEIKQEPFVKQEPEVEDDNAIWTVSRSSHTANRLVLDTLTSDEQMYYTDFVGNLVGAKPEVKIEKDKESVNSTGRNSPAKGNTSKYNARKRFPMGEKQKSRGSNGAITKRVPNAGKNPKTIIVGKKKNSSTVKANQKRHKCSLCDYVTDYKTNLKAHMLKHTGEKPFPCTVCLKRFTQKKDLQSHVKKHVDEFLFSCSICLQGFNHNEAKIKHEAGCKVRRYECHLCKEFSTLYKRDLVQHLRVHTGETPFECDHCSMKFTQRQSLKQHRKTHTNPRPLNFKCTVCFKNFSQQAKKESHEANCKRRGYKCDVCKSYTTDYKSNLVKHMRIHTGEKPFQCEICSKWFSVTSNLNNHKKIHK